MGDDYMEGGGRITSGTVIESSSFSGCPGNHILIENKNTDANANWCGQISG